MQKNSALNRNLAVMGLICLLGFSPLVPAQMYKWVDADGNTHYTQSPPPDGIESDTIKAPPSVDVESAQKSLEQQQEKADSYQEKRKKLSEEQAKQEEDKKQASKNCEIARSNAASLERPRISLKDEQGNVYSASEEERQERLKKAREAVKEFCN